MDMQAYLKPIDPDQPCGEDLEYDPITQSIERLAAGKPEQVIGDRVIPAEEPDWKAVKKQAEEALKRTRDISIAIYLTRALMHLQGLVGLSQGLQLVAGLLNEFWDCVYPQQDEDDDYPVLRMNQIASLNDRELFLLPIRSLPLTDSKIMGRYSLRDIERAKDPEHQSEEGNLAQIEAAFQDTPAERLQANQKAVQEAIQALQSILKQCYQKIGEVNTPSLEQIIKLLQEIEQVFQQHKAASQAAAEPQVTEEQTRSTAPAAEQTAVPAAAYNPGQINNREEVQKAIDAICNYFAQHEPSSPIPFLMQRAKRLLYMDFRELLKDLAPNGIDQAENIFGIQEEAEDKNSRNRRRR